MRHVTSTSARNGQGLSAKSHEVSVTGATAANCQPHTARCEQCSQLFCFKTHGIHRPKLTECLSSKAVLQHLTKNESWIAMGMLQNGSIQQNVARHFSVSQSVISRLWNCHQQTGNVTDFPHSGHLRSTTAYMYNI